MFTSLGLITDNAYKFAMTNHMMSQAVRRFNVDGISHVICETGISDAPYAEFMFVRDGGVPEWKYIGYRLSLPLKGSK